MFRGIRIGRVSSSVSLGHVKDLRIRRSFHSKIVAEDYTQFKSLITKISSTSISNINKDEFDILQDPDTRDSFLEYLVDKNWHKVLWKYCDLIKHWKLPVTTKTYILLLQAASSDHNVNINSCISIYLEAVNHYQLEKSSLVDPLTDSEKLALSKYLLQIFSNCNDFTKLYSLNTIWNTYVKEMRNNKEIRLLYRAAYLGILINSGQIELALDYFGKLLEDDSINQNDLTSLSKIMLPTLLQDNNIIGLINLLQSLIDKNIIIEDGDWMKFLELGLSNNNYELVILVYRNFVMRGFKDSKISIEEAVLHDLTLSNSGFTMINDELIHRMLHTLSSTGDVNSTLSLIESHYLHKLAKGEKALNKELCINIIESYCNHDDLSHDWDKQEELSSKDEKDQSIKRVLSILNGFILKLNKDRDSERVMYKDISSPLSTRFWKYYDYDKNVKKTLVKRSNIAKKIHEDEEQIDKLPRKIANSNIESSKFGNILSNLHILNDFVHIHIAYLQSDPKFQRETITLFINCLLEHLNLYQNFSAQVRVLQTLNHIDSEFIKKWLDADSFDIMLNSLSNSSAAKKCSIVIFQYFKENNLPLTRIHYKNLISANLRGDIHDSLQFFIYQYLKDYGSPLDSEISELLAELSQDELKSDELSRKLFSFLKTDSNADQIDAFWVENKLCMDSSQIGTEETLIFVIQNN
ncbi:mitochondrial splicing apparatus component-domain-containing protein [Scheffersomyces coipomensis]|uniref:mitochondrial splicing apparatus component-domain-containing protein n=1 Tax=Scheffersomyces coipomensis TaxID=1788519 RepID=UPI00315DE88B